MSTKVQNIIEQMSTLTLVEAAELFVLIERNFGVEAAPLRVKLTTQPTTAMSSVDVILETVPQNRRVAILKPIWHVTGLSLKETKQALKQVPFVLKEAVPQAEALKIKKTLEAYGASVTLR